MKNLKIFTFIAILIASILVSCKKETTSPSTPPTTTPTPTNTSVVGTWSWTYLNQGNPGSMTTYTVPANTTLTFASDGTYTSNFNFTIIGVPPALNNDNGTYTNTDSLRMHSNVSGQNITAKVNKITATELWFFYKRYDGSFDNDVHFVK
jgi:hypothetical protein